jgi:uncharacterized protein YndB with AHSA1/START domain
MDTTTELGTIEREMYIEATPETVFEVVSKPEHVAVWWPDEAHYDVVPGADGTIVFADGSGTGVSVQFSVVEVLPPTTFSFRWTHPEGEAARTGNSLFVTFHLAPSGTGTLLTMTETGFREMGWEAAVVEHEYHEHVAGWGHFLPQLVAYAERVASSR